MNNSNYRFEEKICEQGIPVLSADDWIGTDRLDIQSHLTVSTWKDKVVLTFGGREVVSCIQSGRVKFGINKLNDLCSIVVGDLTSNEIDGINSSLKYML